ncbi:MAG: DUF11 domain-containing protein [Burkholderiales bacterium]|nr:DUF11 domain-containing protein [Burkholderiales bacterium]
MQRARPHLTVHSLLRRSAAVLLCLIPLGAWAFDLQVSSFTDTPDPAVAGGRFNYDIVVANGAADAAPASELTVTLHANLSVDGALPAGCTFEAAPARQVRCSLPPLAGTTNTARSIPVSYTAAGSVVVNSTAAVSLLVGDSNAGNNSLTQNTTINRGANLALTKTATTATVPQGGQATFSIAVSNAGPDIATGVRVADTLPANLSFVSSAGAGWSCAAIGQVVSCSNSDNIAVGDAAAPLQITAQVAAGIATGTVTNPATAEALDNALGDGNPSNNTATGAFQVVPGADLSIGKSVSSPVVSGGLVTFTLTPRNNAGSSADAVQVTDTLPAGFTNIAGSGTGWACAPAGQTVTCTRASYAVGAANDISITATAPVTAGLQSFSNTATISSPTADPAPANNTSNSVNFNVQPDGADLTIAKTKTPNPVAQGSPITSTITVRNLGPQAVPAGGTITVTETGAAGETLISANGAGWACGAPAGNAITCTRPGVLALGADAPAITVSSTATAAGTLTNTASVALSGPVSDPVAGNNSVAPGTTSTATAADLSLTKSVDLATLNSAQNTLTYTLRATNNGPGASTNVTVTDPVPMFTTSALHGTTGIVATPSRGACAVNGSSGTVTCNVGTLANGEFADISVQVTRPMRDGPFTNNASVTSPDIGDPNPNNNAASANTTIDPVADVTMTSKSVTPAAVRAGTNATYVLNFRNNGPSAAANVTISDPITSSVGGDSGVSVVSASCSKAGCTCTYTPGAIGSFACNVGSMANGETASATFVVRPNFHAGNPTRSFDNTATIATATTESNAGNNAQSTSLTVQPAQIDLIVNKTDLTDPVGFDPAAPATNVIDYRINVSNAGPSYGSGIQVTDTMTTAGGKNLEFLGLQTTTCNTPAPATCAGGGTTFTGTRAFVCGAFELAAGASCSMDLRFRVINAPPLGGDTYNNSASVGANEPDSNAVNSTENESTTVRVRADLQVVSKTPSLATVDLNQPFDWTVTVRNNGPGDSETTTFTDTLPAGMAAFGAAPSFTKTLPAGSGNCALAGQLVTCAMGQLNANETATITIPVRVTAFPATGVASNSGSVATSEVDTNAGNNSNNGSVNVRRSSVAGRVYNDGNLSGGFNAGEGINGVQITLSGTDLYGNNIARTVSTDAAGSYRVDDLPPGTYQLVETQPAGYADSKEVAGTAGGNAPPACPPAGNCGNLAPQNTIANIVLPAATAATGYDFEEYQGATVSGYVHNDRNNNGQREAGDTGIGGVAITLTGTDYAGNPVSMNAVTAGDGSYSFAGVPPSGAGGYTLTETAQPAGFLDGKDQNGAGAGNVIAASAGRASPETITLAAGTVTPGAAVSERNFGEIEGSTLGGTVYVDVDGNGVKGGGENVGIPTVVITLSGTNDLGQAVNCNVTTNGAGVYSFPNAADPNPACRVLRPGSYTLTETIPAGLTSTGAQVGSAGGTAGATPATQVASNIVIGNPGTSAANYNFGHQGTLLGGSVYVDANDNGIRDAGEPGIPGVEVTLSGNTAGNVSVCAVIPTCTLTTDASGNYLFTSLPASNAAGYTLRELGAGNTPSPILTNYVDGQDRAGTVNGAPAGTAGNDVLSGIVLGVGQVGASYNFGERGQTLSGRVYGDDNNDGVIQGTESGIGNVTITLSGTTSTGVDVCTIVPSCTVTTDANGNYAFNNLPSGSYTLTQTQPPGYGDGRESAGNLGGGVDNASFSANPAQNRIGGINLGAGQSGTNYNFGEQTSKIRGSTYVDANGNGQRDAGESGIAGVTVTLTGTDHLGNPVGRATTTDGNGNYVFDGLRQGTYAVTETHPVIYTDGADRAGSAGGTAGNDAITAIVLGAGVDATQYEFGEQPLALASVRGRVWFDANHDRADNDGALAGRGNWIVELSRAGAVVATTRTDANGDYRFNAVTPNTGYEIRFRNPSNNAVYGNPRVEAGNLVPGSAVANGVIANLNVVSGANVAGQNLPLDPNGVVYNSVTRQPVAGATVTINAPAGFDPASHLLGGTTNVSQVTGADGFYQYILLAGAPAGTYRLTVTAPAGLLSAPSALIQPCAATLNVGAAPEPALVQSGNTAPAVAVASHDPAACPATSAALAATAASTQYFLALVLTPGVSANLVNNHIALDPVLGGALIVQKTTALLNVSRGDLVPYTITATNTLAVTLANIDLRDLVPPGFRYRSGSASLNGARLEPRVAGRELNWRNLSFAPNERKTFRLLLVVGSGVTEGQYVNQAYASNNIANLPTSNVATATVRVVPDPTFDCTDVIGKVFDDKNVNGYEDAGERGIANVRLATARGLLITTDAAGRYHIPCAVVPNELRGSNFVVKLDERTLPSGYRMTTENPRDARATRGKLVRIDFGAGVHRVVRVEVANDAFVPGAEALSPQWQSRFDALPATLKTAPSVVRLAYRLHDEDRALVDKRIEALTQLLRQRWREESGGYPLVIEQEVMR